MASPATREDSQDVTVVIFTGGDPPGRQAVAGLPGDALVICADSGAHHALALGWRPHIVVGDLDSVVPTELAQAISLGAEILRHPVEKDQTDLALALDVAVARRPGARLVVVGGGGGRLDHLLANILLLASDAYVGHAVQARMGAAVATVVRGRSVLYARPGDLVSLLALGGYASGVTTHGLRYRLTDAVLQPGSSWGVSNAFDGEEASVEVLGGVLLAIQPGEAAPPMA